MPICLQVRIVSAMLVVLPALAFAQSIGGPLTPLPAVPELDPARVEFHYQLGRNPSDDDKALIIKFLRTLTGQWEGKPL